MVDGPDGLYVAYSPCHFVATSFTIVWIITVSSTLMEVILAAAMAPAKVPTKDRANRITPHGYYYQTCYKVAQRYIIITRIEWNDMKEWNGT
jgi:hypothetical protein